MPDLPKTARAAVLVGFGEPLEIVDVPLPERLERGALLVKTTAATICASDVHLWEGNVGAGFSDAGFPRILGHEMTGRVVALGPGVTHDSVGAPLQLGDRLIWSHGFCGQCPDCVIEGEPTVCANAQFYMTRPCTEFPYLTGGFAEYCYVLPTSGRVRVPEAVPDALAAAAACALRTVVHGFDRLGALDDRHSIVIQGSGPLGLFALAKALRAGPWQVIVIGGPASRLEIARRWGASHVIDVTEVPDADERAARVRGWTGGRGADVVVEVSGARTAFPEGLDLLRRCGRYLVIGQVHREAVPVRPAEIVLKHAHVIGTISASVRHYHRALGFLEHNRDRFAWADLISGSYPLERINEAMERMRSYEEVKPAITF